MKKVMTVFTFLFCSTHVWAGTFDCSTIYDEFDNLMAKNFLISPQNYVSVQTGKISRADYNGKQKGIFLQKPENAGWGIAIVHTNKNTWGKFMYTWGAPQKNGYPSLIIRNLTLFGRVMDGYAPRSTPLINIPTSYQVDLDTAKITTAGADIWYHNVDGNTMYLEAVNGAELSFPMQSMCK